jgi:hypothetical protein
MGEWKSVETTGNFWAPEKVGEEIVGVLTSRSEGMYGPSYTVKTDKDEFRLPSHKVLQNRLEKVPLNSKVKITFTGTEPPKVRGQNALVMYKVDVWQD